MTKRRVRLAWRIVELTTLLIILCGIVGWALLMLLGAVTRAAR